MARVGKLESDSTAGKLVVAAVLEVVATPRVMAMAKPDDSAGSTRGPSARTVGVAVLRICFMPAFGRAGRS